MESLGINPGFLLVQLVNFSIFALAIWWFGWDRIISAMDARAERIAQGLEDARVAEEARTNAEAEARKIIDQARAEAQSIIKEARDSAEQRAKPIITAAEEEANRIREEANARAADARNAALGDIRGQVVQLAMAAANRLVGEGMSQEQQTRTINEFFSTTRADVSGLGNDLVVTTALPLSDEEKSRLQGQLGGSVRDWRVDPSILGGIIVRSGDRVVDGSVRSGLGNLAASLA